jgi:hypothetical protein
VQAHAALLRVLSILGWNAWVAHFKKVAFAAFPRNYVPFY